MQRSMRTKLSNTALLVLSAYPLSFFPQKPFVAPQSSAKEKNKQPILFSYSFLNQTVKRRYVRSAEGTRGHTVFSLEGADEMRGVTKAAKLSDLTDALLRGQKQLACMGKAHVGQISEWRDARALLE